MIRDSYEVLLIMAKVWHLDQSLDRKPYSHYCRELGFEPSHPDARRAYANGHTWAHRYRREELHPHLRFRRGRFRQAA